MKRIPVYNNSCNRLRPSGIYQGHFSGSPMEELTAGIPRASCSACMSQWYRTLHGTNAPCHRASTCSSHMLSKCAGVFPRTASQSARQPYRREAVELSSRKPRPLARLLNAALTAGELSPNEQGPWYVIIVIANACQRSLGRPSASSTP